MAEINKAYEECDEERIRQILDEWRVSPDQVEGELMAHKRAPNQPTGTTVWLGNWVGRELAARSDMPP